MIHWKGHDDDDDCWVCDIVSAIRQQNTRVHKAATKRRRSDTRSTAAAKLVKEVSSHLNSCFKDLIFELSFVGVFKMWLTINYVICVLQEGVKLADINEVVVCALCSGYLIDAATVTECLHSC